MELAAAVEIYAYQMMTNPDIMRERAFLVFVLAVARRKSPSLSRYLIPDGNAVCDALTRKIHDSIVEFEDINVFRKVVELMDADEANCTMYRLALAKRSLRRSVMI